MIANPCGSQRRPRTGLRVRPIWIVAALAMSAGSLGAEDRSGDEFFETSIRPLLVERCLRCHGAEKQSGGLRLDTRAALLAGGAGGAVVVPGDPDASRLIQAVRHEDLQMPPNEQLSPLQIGALTQWVQRNLPWPETAPALASNRTINIRPHWAFQPIQSPTPPEVDEAGWRANPIDAFVRSRLEAAGLRPSPEADRRTLIRRLSYTLTGLPPTPDEVAAFVADHDPRAYERLVDRLLDSEHYGEHWARHWLDVARYSDTKGYVYAREERFWIHAWVYRDWVARALNEDLPYDRFLLLQMAADQVADRRPEDLAAMGFLTLGRRFLGVERDIIDDRIDVVSRGTMGLTVSCARCHDHKYDPIPTADYYALYGVFDSCRETQVPLDAESPAAPETTAELKKRQDALREELQKTRRIWGDNVRNRIADYLTAQTELHKYPPKGFDQVFSPDDLLPEFVRQWENYLRDAKRRDDPVFRAWHAYAALPANDFSTQAPLVTTELLATSDRCNPLVRAEFAKTPTSFAEVIARYAALFRRIDETWKAATDGTRPVDADPPLGLPDPAAEELRQVLYGPNTPCQPPDEPIVHIESHMDSAACERLWKLQGEVDRWINQSLPSDRWAVVLEDRQWPREPRIFRRGNPATPGPDVPRRFLSLLAGPDAPAFQHGSGRRELAEAIIDPKNPLTARVIVNRVWARHFGTGLVTTPSDFGTRADPPSHPELLDWLATHFVADGWSLKSLQRLLLTSATFRQSSFGPDDPQQRALAEERDPANRWLWRMPTHRLTLEEFRDSLLAASGDLDRSIGGRPSNLFQPPFPRRRTIYGLVDRQYFPGVLRVFDFANPDLHIPQRLDTTVPQQALFVMNHPLCLERAQRLAARTSDQALPAERIHQMYQAVYQRAPTASELAAATDFIAGAAAIPPPATPPTAADWQYLHGRYDEAQQRVVDVVPLPHFTGSAWQGGESWPDASLGWVQLTAQGGHPGNDRAHAAVRRWTAPHGMTVRINSRFIHEPAAGDGVRAFIVSSQQGQLETATVHQSQQDIAVESVAVEPGDTLDFVVDIGDVLNSDQYLWTATITETSSSTNPLTWNSQADFPPHHNGGLSPWEQLAQVLLGSNEFMFVD